MKTHITTQIDLDYSFSLCGRIVSRDQPYFYTVSSEKQCKSCANSHYQFMTVVKMINHVVIGDYIRFGNVLYYVTDTSPEGNRLQLSSIELSDDGDAKSHIYFETSVPMEVFVTSKVPNN